jgi:hypothetical protein
MKTFLTLAATAALFGLLGALVGVICRGRTWVQLTVNFVATFSIFLYLGISQGLFSFSWPSRLLVPVFFEQAAPFLAFYFLPAAFAADWAGKWSRRLRGS